MKYSTTKIAVLTIAFVAICMKSQAQSVIDWDCEPRPSLTHTGEHEARRTLEDFWVDPLLDPLTGARIIFVSPKYSEPKTTLYLAVDPVTGFGLLETSEGLVIDVIDCEELLPIFNEKPDDDAQYEEEGKLDKAWKWFKNLVEVDLGGIDIDLRLFNLQLVYGPGSVSNGDGGDVKNGGDDGGKNDDDKSGNCTPE